MPVFQLTTGFGQHPVAHFHHQAELFKHRDELVRRDQPASRVTPAQQRFGTGQALAVATELRLVVKGELLLFKGMTQVAFQLQTFQRGGVHVRLIELEVVLAAFLGVIHRRVGVLHQLAQLFAVLRAEGDADAGGDEKLAALQHERRHQTGQNPLGHVDRAIQRFFTGAALLQQQGELVATHARHRVIDIDTGEQACGHFLKHAVACGMSQRVIDRFETIQIQKHQPYPGLLTLGLLQR